MTEGTATRTTPDLFARYADDLEVGDSFTTKGRTITEADLVNFAALTWDTYPLHVDAEWASKTMFGERIAHGMLVLSYAAGLVPMEPGPIVAFYGMDKVRFFAPTKIGDTLRVHVGAEGEGRPRRRPLPRDVPQLDHQPARRDGREVDQQSVLKRQRRGLGACAMAIGHPTRSTGPLPGGREGATVVLYPLLAAQMLSPPGFMALEGGRLSALTAMRKPKREWSCCRSSPSSSSIRAPGRS